MDRVRALTQNDIPQVVRLYQKVFGDDISWPLEPLATYFDKVFFQNPGDDKGLSSLVYERDEHTIVGFLGVIPRRLVMKGKSLRVAVSTQFMVENSSRNRLAGLKLLQKFFSGPQDLSFTDGANEPSRRIWKTLGGVEIPIYSICWTRPLRPSRYAVDMLAKQSNLLRALTIGSRPFSWIVDSITVRAQQRDFVDLVSHLSEGHLDIPMILDNLPRLARTTSLRPDYDPAVLTWLLSLAERKGKHGALCQRVVRNQEGTVQGWYVYYLNVGGTSQVLQLVASPESFSAVLEHLFSNARQQGSTAVSGRLDPQYLHEYSRHRCRFSTGSAVLVRTSHYEVLEAIYNGDALLTRLEGEWWNCFNEFLSAR